MATILALAVVLMPCARLEAKTITRTTIVGEATCTAWSPSAEATAVSGYLRRKCMYLSYVSLWRAHRVTGGTVSHAMCI